VEGLSGAAGDPAPSSQHGPPNGASTVLGRDFASFEREPSIAGYDRCGQVGPRIPPNRSRVLNGHPNVSPMTRSKVLAAIQQLGYRPNSAARTLATGHSMTLG